MPIGVIVNCISVLLGGIVGTLLGTKLPDKLRRELPVMLGISSMCIGINAIIKAHSMIPVVISILLGFAIGKLLGIEDGVTDIGTHILNKLNLGISTEDMTMFVSAVTLFCCSGLGWFGALTEGISGNPEILLSKSVLDFTTAMVFGTTLKKSICIVPVPQLIIMLLVFAAGILLSSLLSEEMFADFTACGGAITLATGLRVADIKKIAVLDMVPALIFVFPIYALLSLMN